MPATALDPPMREAMALAWESFRAGSLGIGAVLTSGDDVIATGRNRLFEDDPGADVIAGSSLAHAEINALAKLRWQAHRDSHVSLWTTLQPCLQCAGAIRLSTVDDVHVLAPDPLFRGVERARELNEFIEQGWPNYIERDIDEWAVLALLLQTHVREFWGSSAPGWNEALPATVALAAELVASGELLDAARDEADIDEVAEALWPRLAAGRAEVTAVAERQG